MEDNGISSHKFITNENKMKILWEIRNVVKYIISTAFHRIREIIENIGEYVTLRSENKHPHHDEYMRETIEKLENYSREARLL